jgi:hypothetical protein
MLMMQAPVPCSRNGVAAWPVRTVAIISTDIAPAQPSSSSLMPKAEALLTRTSMPPSAAAASLM